METQKTTQPNQTPTATQLNNYEFLRSSPWTVFILSVITFGIYHIYWFYKN